MSFQFRGGGLKAYITVMTIAAAAPACSDDAVDGSDATTSTTTTTSTGALGGGGDGGSGGEGGMGEGGQGPTLGLVVASNPAGRDADAVVVADDGGAAVVTHGGLGAITSIESIALHSNGDGFITYDAALDTGGLMVVTGLANQASGFVGAGSRRVEGPATGLVGPRGLEIVESLGLVLVADPGAGDVKAFALDASGDAAPSFVVDALGGASVWDLAYDGTNDRLYAAATNGDVLVFDGFSINQGVNGPARTFSPAVGGSKVSVNLHGIEYVPSLNTLLRPHQLVLTDVGDPADGADGQIFTIADPATATDLVAVRARITGPTTALGNPVDLAVDASALGDDLYVAEKANGKVFRFDDITTRTGTLDVAANAAGNAVEPESIALVGGLNGRVLLAANPSGRDADAVVRMLPALTVEATIGDFGDILSVQSAALTAAGDAFVTYDRPGAQGGVLFTSGVANADAPLTIAAGERRIEGPATGLVAPKGVFASEELGVVIVADAGAKRVAAFALDAEGDVAPAWTVDDLGGDRGPWDAAYDAEGDLLFVAATDGVVLVYEAFSADLGAAGPARTIVPAAAGEKVSVNLHGIAYLPAEDLLVLSDVGDAMDAADGQLFTIAGAATADGSVDVRWRLRGPATQLGNPVDLAVELGSVFVAEKANDLLLRFDDVAERSGEDDVAAELEAAFVKPESIATRLE
jgi:hypothetical protein